MKILIKTHLDVDFKSVWQNFNIHLFKALKPPMMPLKVNRFDGSEIGDEVHLDLGFGQKWISEIIENGKNDSEWYFIDEGKLLPPPLKKWKHLHKVIAINKNNTLIMDDIIYQTNNLLLDYLIFPFLYLQFVWRIPAYKKFFKNC